MAFFNEFGHAIHADDINLPGGEITNQPPFAATNIEDRAWRTAEDCVDDFPVGNLPAAFNLPRMQQRSAHGLLCHDSTIFVSLYGSVLIWSLAE